MSSEEHAECNEQTTTEFHQKHKDTCEIVPHIDFPGHLRLQMQHSPFE